MFTCILHILNVLIYLIPQTNTLEAQGFASLKVKITINAIHSTVENREIDIYTCMVVMDFTFH